MDMKKVGNQIAALRRNKGLSQAELGERLGITFQAVSKWERGETLPDTAILVDLANVLETSVDFLLSGGERIVEYRGKISVGDMIEGLRSLERMGQLLGTDHPMYQYAIHGIDEGMNTNMEQCFRDDYAFEAFVAEALIHNLMAGAYVDPSDVKRSFRFDHFREIVLDYCRKYNIK